MIEDALAFWKALRPKVREEIKELTDNTVRRERYDVSTAPDGNKIGVKTPFGTAEIKIPYAPSLEGAAVGDTVIVEWRGTLSTAMAVSYGDGKTPQPESGIKLVKLWENASPGSDFAEQTITNSQFMEYSFFIISMPPMSCILPANTGQILSTNYQAGALDYTMMRRVNSSGDRIVFESAQNKSSAYGWKTNNSVAKPMAIYGIK